MKYTQEELVDMCPFEVAEYIDEVVLPEYANGINTAEMIANAMKDDAVTRLEGAIDSFIAEDVNQKILVAYIQAAFDSWESEND